MNKEIEEQLEKQFPKGHKSRGGVLVLVAIAQIELEKVIKENRILINWLKNLNQKIFRNNEFKGLRGYPLTSFREKYLGIKKRSK